MAGKLRILLSVLTAKSKCWSLGKDPDGRTIWDGKAARVLLREQMKPFKELGRDEQATNCELRERIEQAGLTEEALKARRNWIHVQTASSTASTRLSCTRSGSGCLAGTTEDHLDIKAARQILDEATDLVAQRPASSSFWRAQAARNKGQSEDDRHDRIRQERRGYPLFRRPARGW